jgi:lysophospholipase L1-like esterase
MSFAAKTALVLTTLLTLGAWVAQTSTAPSAPTEVNSATAPVSRSESRQWQARYQHMNAQARRADAQLIFIGDSITQGWETEGKDIWQDRYAKYNALNLGISGDRTQHVLWRLQHGNIEHIKPKLAIVMIGTNNTHNDDNTAEEIAEGITAIVDNIKSKLPDAKILLLGIFPRGEKPTMRGQLNVHRDKIDRVNAIISKLDDKQRVFYLDIGAKFLDAQGVISKDIMPDFLHLSSKGYEIWADAIDQRVKQFLETAP